MLNQLEKTQEALVILYKNGRNMSAKEIYGMSDTIPDSSDASRILHKLKAVNAISSSNESGRVTYALTGHGQTEASDILSGISVDLSKKYDARIATKAVDAVKQKPPVSVKSTRVKEATQPTPKKAKTALLAVPDSGKREIRAPINYPVIEPKAKANVTNTEVVSYLKQIISAVGSIREEHATLFNHGSTLTETNLRTLASLHEIMNESIALKVENARLLEQNKKLAAENERIKENVSAFFSRTGDFTESVLNGGACG